MLVGLSGGGDSVALLHVLRGIAPERRCVAVIVDHALRPGSAAEAETAAAIARDLGAEAEIVTLSWPADAPRGQAAARVKRHKVLAAAARRHDSAVVFLGHTRDDQAETILMRREAGSGPRGLAGMAALSPSPVWPEGRDLWIARPLLGAKRDDLRTHLRAEGLRWIEDPSNVMPRYARVRARAALRKNNETDALVNLADWNVEENVWEDCFAIGLIEDLVRFADGTAVADARLLRQDGADRALAALALAIGGGPREPAPDSVERLNRRLRHAEASTLAGARFVPRNAQLHISRDPGGVHGRRGGGRAQPALPLPEGETVVWDNRLALCAHAPNLVASLPADRRLDGPDLLADAPVERRWLVEDRVRRALWRACPPVFA